MQGILVRVGIDQTSGRWNPPCTKDGRFLFVPIPEKEPCLPQVTTRYRDIKPKVTRFLDEYCPAVRFPRDWNQPTHLDPDFDELTYGDDPCRGRDLFHLNAGDFLAFYASFKPIDGGDLVYALIGFFEVEGPGQPACMISPADYPRNAHTRRRDVHPADVVVRGTPGRSGLFDRFIDIGYRRKPSSYCVKEGLLKQWGGISVRNGWLTRSAKLPTLSDPERFYRWLEQERKKANIHLCNPGYRNVKACTATGRARHPWPS